MSAMTSTNAAGAENDVPVLSPHVDIFESEGEILIDADFPGVTADALSVQLEGLELKLDGRRDGEHPSRLRRTFHVPDTVDANGVEAELRNGVLRVRLPKREEAMPRRIQVRAAE